MDEEVSITEATSDDVSGLEIVRRQAIETGLSDEYDRNEFADLVAKPDLDLPDWISSETFLVLVAKSQFTPFSYGILDLTAGRIKGLYTAETYQQEGHATRILKHFENVARDERNETLIVNAPRNAVEFFRRRGFEDHGTTTQNEPNLELTKLRKPLS